MTIGREYIKSSLLLYGFLACPSIACSMLLLRGRQPPHRPLQSLDGFGLQAAAGALAAGQGKACRDIYLAIPAIRPIFLRFAP